MNKVRIRFGNRSALNEGGSEAICPDSNRWSRHIWKSGLLERTSLLKALKHDANFRFSVLADQSCKLLISLDFFKKLQKLKHEST